MSLHLPDLHRQRGIALISILLIVTLISLMMLSLNTTQQQHIQTLQQSQQQQQLLQYALGAEEYARQLLLQDLRANGNIDHLKESWSQVKQDFPLDQFGKLTLTLEDLQGRININNTSQNHILATIWQRLQWPDQSLLQLQDWKDNDTITADDSGRPEMWSYEAASRTYAPANRPFTELSELRLLPGFPMTPLTPADSWVTALPGNTTLNLNTAPRELLRILIDDHTTLAKIESLRTSPGYLTQEDRQSLDLSPALYGLQSRFFRARILVRYRGLQQQWESIFMRSAPGNTPTVSVIRHQMGIEVDETSCR